MLVDVLMLSESVQVTLQRSSNCSLETTLTTQLSQYFKKNVIALLNRGKRLFHRSDFGLRMWDMPK